MEAYNPDYEKAEWDELHAILVNIITDWEDTLEGQEYPYSAALYNRINELIIE